MQNNCPPSPFGYSSVILEDFGEYVGGHLEYIQEKQAIPAEQHRLVLQQCEPGAEEIDYFDYFLSDDHQTPMGTSIPQEQQQQENQHYNNQQQQQNQQYNLQHRHSTVEPVAKRPRVVHLDASGHNQNNGFTSVLQQQEQLVSQGQAQAMQQQNLFLQFLVNEQRRQASEISELKHTVIRLTEQVSLATRHEDRRSRDERSATPGDRQLTL